MNLVQSLGDYSSKNKKQQYNQELINGGLAQSEISKSINTTSKVNK